jgi:hypothetical protein
MACDPTEGSGGEPAVYVQTNNATENEVIVLSRAHDGALAPVGATPRRDMGRACRMWPRRVRWCSVTMASGCWW